jgi:hypothetical protein
MTAGLDQAATQTQAAVGWDGKLVAGVGIELTRQPTHCNENPVYEFPEYELLGLSTNFYIHVSVSDLYIPRIGPHIFLQQNRQTNRGNI